MKDLNEFMTTVVKELESQGRYGTAHVYQSTLNATKRYWKVRQKGMIKMNKIFNPMVLRDFERYLYENMLSMNTTSTYMRMLRAIYNRAIKRNTNLWQPGLFDTIYTGVKAETKRALLPEHMGKLLTTIPAQQSLQQTQIWFSLLFLLRGMPFIDLARLRKCDLHGNLLIYKRQKTDRILSITVPPEAMRLIKLIANQNADSPYLLSILPESQQSSLSSGFGSKKEYFTYQAILRSFNRKLRILSQSFHLGKEISSYTARHTWATTAYQKKCVTGIICNALGHSSVKVTETDLKAFAQKELDYTNKMIISYVKEKAIRKEKVLI